MAARDELRRDREEHERDAERARGLVHIDRDRQKRTELARLVKALTRRNEALESELDYALGDFGTERLVIPAPARNAKAPVFPMAMWSDWHIEERVTWEETNGLNGYDLAIAEARFRRLLDHTLRLYRWVGRSHSVADIGLWLGGDMITGAIHPDLAETSQLPPGRAAETAEGWIVSGIDEILRRVKADRLFILTSWGNHGRNRDGKRVQTAPLHNFEQDMYRRLAKHYAGNDRVVIDCRDLATKYLEVKCPGRGPFTIRANHGDFGGKLRYQGGLAGLTAPLSRMLPRLDQGQDADLTIFGHWHVAQDLAAVGALANGSMIGDSAYSMEFGHQEPEQVFFWIDLERGRKAGTLPIWCS